MTGRLTRRSDHRPQSSSCSCSPTRPMRTSPTSRRSAPLMAEPDAGRGTVMRALKELEASGLITREPQFHDSEPGDPAAAHRCGHTRSAEMYPNSIQEEVKELRTMSLTNYHYCLRSPALRPSWASVARQRIDLPLRANCRCAGSAVVSTSSPLSFESWSHRERIGLSGWHPLSAVRQTSAASTRSSQPPRHAGERSRRRSITTPTKRALCCRRSSRTGGVGRRISLPRVFWERICRWWWTHSHRSPCASI